MVFIDLSCDMSVTVGQSLFVGVVTHKYLDFKELKMTDKNDNIIFVQSDDISYDLFDGASINGTQWLKELGGISAIEKINNKKAALLYSEIDRNSLFKGFVSQKEDRSKMNATFNLTDTSLEDQFNTLWTDAGINGLKGHRSVGGYRASMYNALPLESVQVLVDVMKELERKA